MNISVLLVEDDYDLAASLVDFFELESISCDHASNGLHGLELAKEHDYDVVVLDIMLPKMDGLTVCDKLRKVGVDVPILMLTSRDTLDDKIAGFSVGTDDYLVKPFAMKELLFRVRALSKRRSSQPRVLNIGDLQMNLETEEVIRDGQSLHLTPIEWKLLMEMVRLSPKVVSRVQLMRAAWGDEAPESNSLKVHMHKLRQKVDRPFGYPLIHTVSKRGFMLREKADEGA